MKVSIVKGSGLHVITVTTKYKTEMAVPIYVTAARKMAPDASTPSSRG